MNYRRCLWFPFFQLFLFVSTLGISQQYNIFMWENFESEVLPNTLAKYGKGSEENVFVTRYDALNGFPGIQDGIARTESGKCGLYFQATPSGRYLRVVSTNKLDRLALSENASAIVQADFFIRELSVNMLGVALLAAQINPNTPTLVDRFYRLGFNNLGEIYFSRYDSQIENRTTSYSKENTAAYGLKIPGWHRFQMVFKGQNRIFCYIDGQQTSFSPVEDPALTSLQMGVMVASSLKESLSDCIIDNLSIQIADEEAPLPRSPWRQTYSQTIQNPAFLYKQEVSTPPQSDLKWFTTPEEAVQYNLRKRLPYLVLFYSPFARANASLERILSSNKDMRNYLTQFVLVSVDVNQLGGGSLAKQMSVFKCPCFILLNPEGNETSRATYTDGMSWQNLRNVLQKEAK